MQKLNLSKIRGRWQEMERKIVDVRNPITGRTEKTLSFGRAIAGGDDTEASLKLIAEKVNEFVAWSKKIEEILKLDNEMEIEKLRK